MEDYRKKVKLLYQNWNLLIKGLDEEHPQVKVYKACINDMEVVFQISVKEKEEWK